MSLSSSEKTAQHLMRLITTRNGEVPNFSLLLGSGASATSKVKTAMDMIREWREMLFAESGCKNRDGWLAMQAWHHHDDEYSLLFESVYDQPSQRRVYIEECLTDAHPNWGYVYLTSLLANRYFDVVFTTNFDDLINEACYLYSDGLRPIVAAHDSVIQGVRVTSGRPKIIKMHGDFLYDNIKNTLAELETLEANTKRKLQQFAQEYGLIVIGYSGRDRSVMDTLDLLLRDDENYKQGVYWCKMVGDQMSDRLQSLLRRDRVYLVEIDGFDQFVAELHEETAKSLPQAIRRPFDLAEERAQLFISDEEIFREHRVIGKHRRQLIASLESDRPRYPQAMHAALLSEMGEVEEAVEEWEKALEKDPNNTGIAYGYANALADANKPDELAKFMENTQFDKASRIYLLLRAQQNDQVVKLSTDVLDDAAENEAEDPYIRINRAIALKRLGRLGEMESDLDFLEQHEHDGESNLRAGIAALRQDKINMINALDEALGETIFRKDLFTFPVFEDYQDDEEFLEFIDAHSNGAV